MRTWTTLCLILVATFLIPTGCGGPDADGSSGGGGPLVRLQARADSLALSGRWTAPPGDARSLEAASLAASLCGAAFITGTGPADALAVTQLPGSGPEVTDTAIDTVKHEVRLTLTSGVTRSARVYGSQGCVVLPEGADTVNFAPKHVKARLPAAQVTPWPLGDDLSHDPWPTNLDSMRIAAAIEEGFGPPDAETQAIVVTYRGRIVGERYGEGMDAHTALPAGAMGEVIAGTLLGVLVQQRAYELMEPAPIPAWQGEGDARAAIRIADLTRMSSGLRSRSPRDPDYDPSLGVSDELWYATGAGDAFEWAASRSLQWPPGEVGRDRATDAVLAGYLIRLAVEKRGEDYLLFPQRALFDRIGVRDAVIGTDPYGNLLTQSAAYLSARDWARLGDLYLNDGVVRGDEVLPEGWVDFAKEPAPAWVADGRPVRGGAFFHVNGDGAWPAPKRAFMATDGGGRVAMVIPSRGLVVVRLGRDRGATAGVAALRRGLRSLLSAVPELQPGMPR
ncbi:MAG: serine hydrolase domain-containing protein [Gemmatimonadota bacterium]